MTSRYLMYEANQTSGKPERGEVVAVNTDGTVDLYTGAMTTTNTVAEPIYLRRVAIMGAYTPKIGDWVGISWDSSFPMVMGDVTTTLTSVGSKIDGNTVIRNQTGDMDLGNLEDIVDEIIYNVTENLIVNSGFELDDGWTSPQNQDITAGFTKDRTQNVFGTKSLTWYVNNTTTTGHISTSQTVPNILPSTKYTLSYFYKDTVGNIGDSGGLRHEIKIEQYDISDTLIPLGTITYNPPNSNKWGRFYQTFETQSNTSYFIIYIKDLATSTGVSWQCWYDGVQLEVGDIISPYNSSNATFEMTKATSMALNVNLLENSSFEYYDETNTYLSGWVLPNNTKIAKTGNWFGSIGILFDDQIKADIEQSINGRPTQSIKIQTNAESQNNYLETEKPLAVNGNDFYTISAFVRAVNIPESTPVVIKIREFDASNNEIKTQSMLWAKVFGTTPTTGHDTTNGFIQIYECFRTTGTTAYVKIQLCSPALINGTTAMLWWDNIQLQRGKIVTAYNPREIVGTQIANGVITTEHVIATGIHGKKITAGTIEADRLKAKSITSDYLNVGLGGRNYVKNSSFENLVIAENSDAKQVLNWASGMMDTDNVWQVYDSICRSPNTTVVTTDPFYSETKGLDERSCLKVRNEYLASTNNHTVATSDYFLIKSSTEYMLSVWLKKGAYLQNAKVSVLIYDFNLNFLERHDIADPQISVSDWTHNQKALVTHLNSYKARIRIYNEGGISSMPLGSEANLFIDMLQLEEGTMVTDWTPHSSELSNDSGSVIINDEGITIYDGKLKLINTRLRDADSSLNTWIEATDSAISTRVTQTDFENEVLNLNDAISNVKTVVYNPDFSLDKSLWSSEYVGKSVPETTVGTIILDSNNTTGGKVLQITGDARLFYMNPIPVNVNRTYKARFRVRQTNSPTVANTSRVYAGVATLDANYNNITGGAGTHRYFIVNSENILNGEGWHEYEGTITGVGDAHNNFRAGTAYVRPMFIVNYQGGNGTAQVDLLEFLDITDDLKIEKNLQDQINNFSSDSKITLAEANSLKATLAQMKEESYPLIGNAFDLLVDYSAYETALIGLDDPTTGVLTPFINQASYPKTILPEERTAIEAQLGLVQDTKSALINKIIEAREANANAYTDGQVETTLNKIIDVETKITQNSEDIILTAKRVDIIQGYDENGVYNEDNKYATQGQLQVTADAINANFTSGGGVNLIKNSVGYADKDFWTVTGTVTTEQNSELETKGAGSAFVLAGGTLNQSILTKLNEIYTISTVVKKGTSGTGYFRVINGTEIKTIDFVSGIEYDYVLVQITVQSIGNQITIELYGDLLSKIKFTSTMANIGTVPLQWQHSAGEIYNTNVRMNLNGIKVFSTAYDGYTSITPEEFAGYATIEGTMQRVFTLNGATTVMANAEITDEKNGIFMTPIRVKSVTSGGWNGWAFISD